MRRLNCPSLLMTMLRFVTGVVDPNPKSDVELVTMGYRAPLSYTSLAFSAPAIDSAMEFLNSKYGSRFTFRHTYLYVEEESQECNTMEAESTYVLSKWYYTRNSTPALTALISPGCKEIVPVNRLAASWNIMMITSSGSDVTQRRKAVSPTWIAAGAVSATNYVLMPINWFKQNNWTNIFFVLDMDAARVYQLGVAGLLKYVPESIPEWQPTVRRVYSSTGIDYREILLEFNATSRVAFFLSHSDYLRQFMLQAHAMNMTNGDYVYNAEEIFHSVRDFGNYSWQYHDQHDEAAKEAYRSLILFNGDPAIYKYPADEFVQRWKTQTEMQFNYTYGLNEEMTPVATATYAAFAMFGQVLWDTLDGEPDFDLSDGTTLAAQFFDTTFHLNFSDVYIDLVGERSTKIMINDLNVSTGQWQVAMYQDESFRKLRKVTVIDWGGTKPPGSPPPLNEPACGYRGNKGICTIQPDSTSATTYGVSIGAAFSVMLLMWTLALAIDRRRRLRKERVDFWFLLDRTQLTFDDAVVSLSRQLTQGIHPLEATARPAKALPKGPAWYGDVVVWTDRASLPMASRKLYIDGDAARETSSKLQLTKEVSQMFRTIREAPLDHINKFIGFCAKPELCSFYLASSLCSRGCLHDVFQKPFFEDQFRISLIVDLLEGLTWLHSSTLRFHGALTGCRCLVDQHFSLKVAKVGYAQILHVYESMYGELERNDTKILAKKLLWTAPDILRKESSASPSGDVYALGIILNQVIWSVLPYAEREDKRTPSEIIKAVRIGSPTGCPLRPLLADQGPLPSRLNSIIQACWQEDHEARPSVTSVKQQVFVAFKLEKHARRGLMEDICHRLEVYAENLEEDVATRTLALIGERRRCDQLLRQMLPRKIVEQLRSGKPVYPEKFSSVTVMFTKIHGFAKYAILNTPSEVTELLNTIYSIFDGAVKRSDAYKVETTGECYMVASGLPERNGEAHALVLAHLALAFHKDFRGCGCQAFLDLQTGINSGPCVAGIVGYQKPRYCLFGDTVNTASRMESTALPNTIQISQSSKDVLDKQRTSKVVVKLRGAVHVRGKGIAVTYWVSSAQND